MNPVPLHRAFIRKPQPNRPPYRRLKLRVYDALQPSNRVRVNIPPHTPMNATPVGPYILRHHRPHLPSTRPKMNVPCARNHRRPRPRRKRRSCSFKGTRVFECQIHRDTRLLWPKCQMPHVPCLKRYHVYTSLVSCREMIARIVPGKGPLNRKHIRASSDGSPNPPYMGYFRVWSCTGMPDPIIAVRIG